MLDSILKFIADYRIGDLSSIFGLFISLVGFAFTIWGIMRTKKAAEAAKESALQVQNDLRKLDIIMEFSAAITMMDEIKRHHRGENWHILPDRYSAMRKKLITIKSTYNDLTENQKKVLQSAINQFKSMETTVEKALGKKTSPNNRAKFNEIISNESDKLNEVLSEIKIKMEVMNYGR